MTRMLLQLLLILVPLPAWATFHTWRIDEIYSNADGTLQFVVLHESQGANGENLLAGHALTVTHAGRSEAFVFPGNIGDAQGGYGSAAVATANRRVLIGSERLCASALIACDYAIRNGFLPTDGGTLDFAGVDSVAFDALPTDGVNAKFASGSIGPNRATNFLGASASVPPGPITAVEFYHAGLDHYFISALQPDIDALDSGRFAGWVRTGSGFDVYATQDAGGPGVQPVCRFYIPPELGDSHFFSASTTECAETHAKFPALVLESSAVFYVALPDTTNGACPAGTRAVYRLWNARADSNHRYVTDRDLRAAMIARGYVSEGYGPDGVAMCAAGT